jgi:MerR family mercuric resistance operon transcriptional regulator
MRIGELARRTGVAADTLRFYEREGVLPRSARAANGYREYDEADAEHVRLLADLRSLEIPLADAAEVARFCHSGHCDVAAHELPELIERQRQGIAERIARLHRLDDRLADLAGHLGSGPVALLPMAPEGACCDAAAAVLTAGEGRCACCSTAT